ncbi:MAG TPA: acylphosphatase [Chloroflexi bacterium]|jgi:acylphosphatase|nr:acylphosphatase [Chloroflexota bacterium]
MNDTNQVHLHAFVEGRVQGVSFRFFVLRRAQEYQLNGWVRNTPNNEVEVRAEGPQDRVHQLLKDLWKGPPAAFVTNVRTEWNEPTGKFNGFKIDFDYY